MSKDELRQALIAERKRQGLSVEKLGEMITYGKNAVERYEEGKGAGLVPYAAFLIADALGYRIDLQLVGKDYEEL